MRNEGNSSAHIVGFKRIYHHEVRASFLYRDNRQGIQAEDRVDEILWIKPNTITPPGNRLKLLPLDVLLLVTDRLDIVSQISFPSTCRAFYEMTTIDHTAVGKCAKWLMSIFLEYDRGYPSSWVPYALCQTRRHKRYFGDGKDWAFINSDDASESWLLRALLTTSHSSTGMAVKIGLRLCRKSQPFSEPNPHLL